MKRLSYIHHYFPVIISLVYLTIMINSYPLDGYRPTLLFPDEHYNNDFDEYIMPDDINKILLTGNNSFTLILKVAGKKIVKDTTTNDVIKSSEIDRKLIKKNSELISTLMALRRAITNKEIVRNTK